MLEIKYKKLEEIKLYENNPRNNDEAVEYVANSIKEFGFKVPIVVDASNIIVAGHTRYKACVKLGITEVPCIVVDDLTEEQIKAFRLADNKTAEIATWDLDLLKQELGEIGILDMTEFGFDFLEEDNSIEEIVEDNYNVDENIPEEPQTKLGDIYKLGNHRLMCGDSTNITDVAKLMNGNQADMLLTDPPYNVDVESTNGKKIKNDNMDSDSFRLFLYNAFKSANEVLKNGASFYIWHGESEGYNFRGACQDIGWKIRQCLIWNKNTIVLGRQDYQWKHEPCLYGWKDGASHYFINDRTQSTVYEEQLDFDKMKKEDLKNLLKEIYADKIQTTILNEDKPTRNAEHPTMKPVKLMARLIKNSSLKNQIILDLFGGSGSTLIACEQLERNCYMMELEPAYCDVIINRWENLTGQKAEKIYEIKED